MPSTYTPTANRITPLTVVSDGDGPHIKAADVAPALEGLADGALYATLGGADRLDVLATTAALTAIAAPTDKLVRHVFGYGLYVFIAGAADAVAAPVVLAADDATPGRWFNAVASLRDFGGGLAGLDATQAVMVMGVTWPTFQGATRARVRAVSVHDFAITDLLVVRAKNVPFAPFGGANSLAESGNAALVQGALELLDAPSGTATQGIQICIDAWVHDGARLTEVIAGVQGGPSHVGVDGAHLTQASIGVFRKPVFAGTYDDLQAASSFVTDAQATTGAYEAEHALFYLCDQNNVIDTSAFSYFVQVWGEFGAYAQPGMKILGLQLIHDSIADMRFP